MPKIITMTAFNRPSYFQAVISALRQCELVDEYDIIINIDRRGEVNQAVVNVAQSITFGNSVTINVNSLWLGNTRNTYDVISKGFEQDNFVIHIEDDTVPARDLLVYMENLKQQLIDDPEMFSIGAYNRKDASTSEEFLASSRVGFHCWIFGILKSKWETYLNAVNPVGKGIYSRDVDDYVKANNLREIYPKLSRVQNIGQQNGTHVTPEFWAANHRTPHFFNARGISRREEHQFIKEEQ